MPQINLADAQDVFRDAGKNVLFTTLLIDQNDRIKAREAMACFADRLGATERSLNVRYPQADLRVAFGLGTSAWQLLFPTVQPPKELVAFQPVVGPKYTAPATPGDLFLHIRANDMAVVYEIASELREFLHSWTSVVDETVGFRYFEGRAIIGFVDGTENPSGPEAPEYAVIGDEDPDFINGSYAFAQKYTHNLDAWNNLATEDQERAIGRHKFSDQELYDDDKLPNAHNLASQDNDDGVEHKIVRMNVPYGDPSRGVAGTYFIGYARHFTVTQRMLENMFTQSDRLLDFSTPITGNAFFIPSWSLLARIADGDLFPVDYPDE
ncbi:iron-dependent peroxidase [Levilactobacillus paucivorans]|uniref:Iron-dependent peroxidase n=1 Tax=Levilactobacillus paucivorans TaxID=616990 RepID=A0A0R2LSI0_9LACO|nr:Dyp-type peroxidase [Levilactobacillus paucivorans]KRO04612.1 iron-dependent peroxidase [Levilactobacillus paucivorans]